MVLLFKGKFIDWAVDRQALFHTLMIWLEWYWYFLWINSRVPLNRTRWFCEKYLSRSSKNYKNWWSSQVVSVDCKMKVLVVLTLLVGISLQSITPPNRRKVPSGVDPLSDKMVDFINRMDTTWKACDSPEQTC